MIQHTPTTIKPLLGKIIDRALLKDGDVIIYFSDGTSVFCSVAGDCCSRSVYYDLEFRGDWRGPLVEVTEGCDNNDDENKAYRKAWDNGSGEVLRLWNVEFRTEKGAVILKHINDSNGFYDGCTGYQIRSAPLASILNN